MASENLGVAFLFTPQGSHYAGMGKVLYRAFPVFAQVVEEAEALFENLKGSSLKEAIWSDSSSFDSPDICGPGIYTLQIGLVKVLRSFGIIPTSVLGHSFGEYAAAVCAGVLSFEDGFRLVLGRAHLINSNVREGRLTALRATLSRVNDLLTKFEQAHGTPPEIAAVNANDSIVVGGSLEIVSQFETFCSSEGIEFMRLSASAPFAYHTSDMDPILEDLGNLTSTMTHGEPTARFISSSTGEETKLKDFGAEYWKGLSRNRIQFSKAIRTLCSKESILVEIGPTPKLINLALKNFESHPPHIFYAMSQEESNTESLLKCLSKLSCEGVRVNWDPWFQRCVGDEATQNSSISSNTGDYLLEKAGDEVKGALDSNKVEVALIACSLNYKDKGNFQNGRKLGYDLAGIVKSVGAGVKNFEVGDTVYGISMDGNCLNPTVTVPQRHLAKVPPNLSPISASTLPLTYLIAWKALVEIGEIGVGDRVLVNFGRGWIGIALANIALHFGSKVFALSGSSERRKYLESLGISNIYDMVHGIDFGSMIMKDTQGKGLTVVVNNFEDPFLKELSLALCASGGKFVDVSPGGHWTPEAAHQLCPDVDYSVVDVTKGSNEEISGMWHSLSDHFKSGLFPPFPQKTFPLDSLSAVFEWFQQGKLGMAKPVILMPEPKM